MQRRVRPSLLHEIKHDGFRVIARKDGARVRLENT
jgi:ATP-dependent DNA ligase